MAEETQPTAQTLPQGEQSAPQIPPRPGANADGLMGAVAGLGMEGPLLKPPPAQTYATFRKMMANPTIALARAVAMAPIRMAKIIVRGKDDTPPERVEFIQEMMKRIQKKLVRDMLRALDFGFAPFENIYELDDSILTLKRVKPLLADKTKILVSKGGSMFMGFKQKDVELVGPKAFIYTNDQEGDDFYGHSRHEAAVEPWHSWTDLRNRQRQFAKKVAGVIPMITYPEGRSEDKNGSLVANFTLAERLLVHLGQGNGVVMPDTLAKYAGDMLRAGFNPQDWRAWKIELIEAKGLHGKDFVTQLSKDEALMLRGWTVPERAATEGQFGTKAEAQEHGGLSLAISDLTLGDIVDTINLSLINPLLVLNWGPEAAGSVFVESEGLDSMTRMFFRGLMEKILSHPDNVLILRDLVDLAALSESVGLPMPEEKSTLPSPIIIPGVDDEAIAASRKLAAAHVIMTYAQGISSAAGITVDD